MKFSMLFKHKGGVGLCEGNSTGFGNLFPLSLKLRCLFKTKMEINYFVKDTFEGWKKEDYGTTKKVTPLKIFFKHINRKDRIKIIENYIKNLK